MPPFAALTRRPALLRARPLPLVSLLLLTAGTFIAAGPAHSAPGNCAGLHQELDARHAASVATPAGPGTPRDRALRDLEQAVFDAFEACPDDPLLLTLMGEVQLSLGQIPLAIAYGARAVELGPDEWRPHQLLGSLLSMTGEHDRGIAELTRAVELSGGRARVRLNLASAEVWAGRYAEALPRLEALAGDPDPVVAAAATHLRGKAKLGLGRVDAAKADFARAIELGYRAQSYEVPRSAIER